jgi:hypothetical protein
MHQYRRCASRLFPYRSIRHPCAVERLLRRSKALQACCCVDCALNSGQAHRGVSVLRRPPHGCATSEAVNVPQACTQLSIVRPKEGASLVASRGAFTKPQQAHTWQSAMSLRALVRPEWSGIGRRAIQPHAKPNLAFNRTCHGRRLWPGAGALRSFSGAGPKPPAASRRLTLR